MIFLVELKLSKMADLFYRTEDIPNDEILNLFVETKQDREIIEMIKAISPVILIGSRGVGKSFLLRIAEEEMMRDFTKNKVLPVYLTFTKSSLLHSSDPRQFQNWMLARICSKTIRTLRKKGFLASPPRALSVLSGGLEFTDTKIESIANSYENSWQNPNEPVEHAGLPTIEDFIDAIEEICSELDIKRINLLIDEAAHIFRPEQQRQFFTLFRDLRTPYISCNAAVYPGVTSYGDTFQSAHDATFITINRDILHHDYISKMREIVERQLEADSDLLNEISKNGQNFAILAFAATGNPRLLLKTIVKIPKISSKQLNEVIREYYRVDLWSEHSGLSQKYPGHSVLIDWGRKFIETIVLPELQKKNIQYLEEEKNSTCFLWIHRDAPEPVKEAMRLLSYTGIVVENAVGIKATRSEIGTRYLVNLGCLFALEATPASTAFQIAKSLTPKRMSEYGMNYSAFNELLKELPSFNEIDLSDILKRELEREIDVLDLSGWQIKALKQIGIQYIKDIIQTTDEYLKSAYYIGDKRARRMRSAALASVYEYLNG
jgi:hypothetical protein